MLILGLCSAGIVNSAHLSDSLASLPAPVANRKGEQSMVVLSINDHLDPHDMANYGRPFACQAPTHTHIPPAHPPARCVCLSYTQYARTACTK